MKGVVISLQNLMSQISPSDSFNTVSRALAWDECYRRLGEEISELESGELLVTVGLPLSGKTYFCNRSQLHTKYDVIFDVGLNTKESRSCVLNMAKGLGWEVDCLFVDTPFKVCRKRNSTRKPSKRIPFSAFQSMCRILHKPKKHEGFRKLSVVTGN